MSNNAHAEQALAAGPTPTPQLPQTFNGFVTRQPVYTRHLDVFGYELKFGGEDAVVADGASPQTVVAGLEEVGLDALIADRRAIIVLPRDLLVEGFATHLPRERVVLGIAPQDVEHPQVVEAAVRLARDGYHLLVDAAALRNNLARARPGVDWVRLDVGVARPETWPQLSGKLHAQGLKLFVDHVNTRDELVFLQGVDVDYLQGEYFTHPCPIEGHQIPANRLATVHLLARIQDPEVDIQQVEELVSQDATLSYKLLRLINSAFYAMPGTVDSIRRAVIFLGLQRVKNWASVIVLSAIDYKPREILHYGLVRARMCELLAQALDEPDQERHYIVGLFSVLNAIMSAPMQVILQSLPLTYEIGDALVGQRGRLGEVLRCVLAYEKGRWGEAQRQGLTPTDLTQAYLQAIEWAQEVQAQLRA
jgi:EAL and modified HD-GYP domain-containing signal transduction protein